VLPYLRLLEIWHRSYNKVATIYKILEVGRSKAKPYIDLRFISRGLAR